MVRARQCYLKTSWWPRASYIRQLFPLQNLSYWHPLKATAMNQMAVNWSSFSPTTPCKARARATWPQPLLGRERFATLRRTRWPYLGTRTLGNTETPACLWMRNQCWWKNLFLVISLGTKDLMNFPAHHLDRFKGFYYLYFHEDSISSSGCPDGLDVLNLLSNISSLRQVYVPSAVKLSVENTNSGRYISPCLQPMVTHMQTWLQGVDIAHWFCSL